MARYNTFFDPKFVFLNVHYHVDLHETVPYWIRFAITLQHNTFLDKFETNPS